MSKTSLKVRKRSLSSSSEIARCQKQVDKIITRILNQLPPEIHGNIDYLFKGKRIRSTLMFSLGSHLGCRLSEAVLPAVGVEIVHTISLIHDDVIDHQDIRRDQPTLHCVYGNRAAIFMGDFLLQCLAGEICRLYGNFKITDALYLKIAELCRGEVLQDIPIGIISPGRGEYLQMIRQKTGSLFSYSFIVPALLTGKQSDDEVIGFAEECGYLFGLAFQLADDVADLEEDAEVIRKDIERLGGDLPERLFSYPILLWQEIDAPGFKGYLSKPSSPRLQQMQSKLGNLIYREILEQLSHLEEKSHKLNQTPAAEILNFLSTEIDKLFKKNI